LNSQLLLAKEETYTKGFYEGIMLKGSQKGKRVEDAKFFVRAEMIAAGIYSLCAYVFRFRFIPLCFGLVYALNGSSLCDICVKQPKLAC